MLACTGSGLASAQDWELARPELHQNKGAPRYQLLYESCRGRASKHERSPTTILLTVRWSKSDLDNLTVSVAVYQADVRCITSFDEYTSCSPLVQPHVTVCKAHK